MGKQTNCRDCKDEKDKPFCVRARGKRLDIKALVKNLQSKPDIKGLCLSNCQARDEDARQLAKLTHLISLNLRYNYISNEGAKELANLTSFN
ncbi:MAG: hypothetical protein ACEY3A_03795 [Wolbachia sp.]